MHLAHLRLRDFRNYPRLDADFSPGFHLLLGNNAQGKTNILEAIYLLATLRSFRGVGGAQLVRHGAKGYFVGASVQGVSPHEIKMYWSLAERKLALDGQAVRRLTDYLGTLRAVVFCTEDLQLVKGAARARRRFLDLLLAQTQPHYLPLLQRYAQALRSRNSLLKQRAADPGLLDSFSQELVTLGTQLTAARRELLPRISPLARLAYRRISNDAEELRLDYKPSVKADFAVELAHVRDRERTYRTTLIGPHRDDLSLAVRDLGARAFASHGEAWAAALCLRLGLATAVEAETGERPVLFLDDPFSALDPARQKRISGRLAGRGQVFVSVADDAYVPDEAARVWSVAAGALTERGAA